MDKRNAAFIAKNMGEGECLRLLAMAARERLESRPGAATDLEIALEIAEAFIEGSTQTSTMGTEK